jgi:hypothetical protein
MEGTGQLVLGGCRVAADPFHTDTVCNAGVGTECSPSFYGKKEKERTEKRRKDERGCDDWTFSAARGGRRDGRPLGKQGSERLELDRRHAMAGSPVDDARSACWLIAGTVM